MNKVKMYIANKSLPAGSQLVLASLECEIWDRERIYYVKHKAGYKPVQDGDAVRIGLDLFDIIYFFPSLSTCAGE